MSFSSSTPRSARTARALVAVVLGLAGAVAFTAPAHAAPAIDPDAEGSINIHKFAQPVTPGAPGTGAEIDTDPLGLDPLEGVTFQIQPVVGLDLTDPANWAIAEDLAPGDVTDSYTLGAAVSGETDESGDLTFSGLGVGMYLVTETGPGANNIVFPTPPFLVTIPLPVNDDWLYDVHVYPKNTVVPAQKSVDDSQAHILGETVTWRVSTRVPAMAAGGSFDAFGMTDALDARLAADLSEVVVELDGHAIDSAHYVADLHPDTDAVRVRFTPTGLDLLGGKAGQSVVYVIPTTVVALGEDGTIENTASVFVNDPSTSNSVTFDTNTVDTEWGAVQVTKVDAGDSGTVLEGATFDIFLASDTTTPVGTLTTGPDGTASATLKVGDYVLVETEAPTGYLLDSRPIPFPITAGATTDAYQLEVANHEVPAFLLPLTGGAGGAVFLIGGVGLLALAGGILLRRRTRSTVHA